MNSLNVKVIKLYFWFCSELAINWCSSEVTQFNLTIVCWYKTRQTKLTAWHLLTSRHCSIIHLFIFSFNHCKNLGWNTDNSDTELRAELILGCLWVNVWNTSSHLDHLIVVAEPPFSSLPVLKKWLAYMWLHDVLCIVCL